MENNQPSGVSTKLGAVLSPPKKWDELTSDEKIETLRSELFNTRYLAQRIGSLETELHRLKQHQHGDKGDVLIPLSVANNSGSANLGMRSYDPLT